MKPILTSAFIMLLMPACWAQSLPSTRIAPITEHATPQIRISPNPVILAKQTLNLSRPLHSSTAASAPLSELISNQFYGANLNPSMTSSTVYATDHISTACSTTACESSASSIWLPSQRSHPALERLLTWLSYRPGPSQLPILVPSTYTAPLRAYFPCTSSQSGSTYGSESSVAVPRRSGLFQNNTGCKGSGCDQDPACRAPLLKGYGAFARPSGACPTTGPIGVGCAPVAVPLPAACVGTRGCRVAAGPCMNPLDRMLSLFVGSSHRRHYASDHAMVHDVPQPTSTVPYIMGYTFPSQGQYRYAHPTSHPSRLPSANQHPLPFTSVPYESGAINLNQAVSVNSDIQ